MFCVGDSAGVELEVRWGFLLGSVADTWADFGFFVVGVVFAGGGEWVAFLFFVGVGGCGVSFDDVFGLLRVVGSASAVLVVRI